MYVVYVCGELSRGLYLLVPLQQVCLHLLGKALTLRSSAQHSSLGLGTDPPPEKAGLAHLLRGIRQPSGGIKPIIKVLKVAVGVGKRTLQEGPRQEGGALFKNRIQASGACL